MGIKYSKANDFFSEQDLEVCLKIPHIVNELGDITVYSFNVNDKDYSNDLRHVNIVRLNGDFTSREKELELRKKHFEYVGDIGYDFDKRLNLCNSNVEYVGKLIRGLKTVDEEFAKKLWSKYNYGVVNDKYFAVIANKVLLDTDVMINYLEKEQIKSKNLNLDMSLYDGLTEDELEVEYKSLRKTHKKEIKSFEGFNDLDYYPYMFDNYYLIEDVSSSSYFICKKENNELTWYHIERDNGFPSWMNEFAYDTNQINNNVFKNLNEFGVVAKYVDGKLVKATVGMDTLNLLQGYIVDELMERKKLTTDHLPKLSFKDLLRNYNVQMNPYCLEERCIGELLSKIKEIDGKMLYEDMAVINNDLILKHSKKEGFKDYTFEILERDLKNFPKLNKENKESVLEYINEISENDDSENRKKCTDFLLSKMNKEKKISPK